jgi:hypothetical protein
VMGALRWGADAGACRAVAVPVRAGTAVRCAGRLPGVGVHRRRGFRPRGRLTFFAGAKKVSQESTLNTTRRAVVAADTGRYAPAGGAHSLAQQALDRVTCAIAAVPQPTRWTRLHPSGTRKACGVPACLHAGWRCPALQSAPRRFARYRALLARAASAAKREGPPAAECRHSGARASWPHCNSNLASGAVERLLRETVRATGRSAATGVYGHHRTPRCIAGAFLAYFLCTSKESESAAGPKPPPALQTHTRQMHRAAHGTTRTTRTTRTPVIDLTERRHARHFQQPMPTP